MKKLAIVGAGPAGLGAAKAATEMGLNVVVIDDQLEPGGQIWRSAGSVTDVHAASLGREFQDGRRRVQAFQASGQVFLPGHIVWNIERDEAGFVLYVSGPDGGKEIRAETLLLATGAIERPTPIPGWTLPGVMSCGALQILLKTAGVVNDRVVLSGGGPLLWLVAAQLVERGHPPLAVVEQVPLSNYVAALPRLLPALRDPGPLVKGLGLIAKVVRAGVPIHFGAHDVRMEGEYHLEAVRFKTVLGRERRIEADAAALHFGVVPNQQATRLLRLQHGWNEGQQAFAPQHNETFEADPSLYLAGDGTGIGGAEVAWLEGQLVGAAIAGVDRQDLRKRLRKAKASRPFLDRLYAPPTIISTPEDDTVVCRCEAITAGQIRRAVCGGAMGPNQVKFMIRPGMGPCQGRMCGLALSTIVADCLDQSLNQVGYLRIRPPLKPISLGSLVDTVTEPMNPSNAAELLSAEEEQRKSHEN